MPRCPFFPPRYRARVEKVESLAKVHVFYIDYGNVSGGGAGEAPPLILSGSSCSGQGRVWGQRNGGRGCRWGRSRLDVPLGGSRGLCSRGAHSLQLPPRAKPGQRRGPVG